MIQDKNSEPQVLMKNNIITKAKFNITTVENRVFQLVMYKLQKKGIGTLSCSIHIDEFKAIIKNKNQCNHEAIADILIALRKQSIYFKKTKAEQTEDKKGKKPFSVWGEWGIINGHEFDEETQEFYIESSEKIHSLLHEYLEGGYTPINLSIFFSLSNSNAQRFYDLLRLWTNTKKVINYKVDELKELLMIDGKYPRYVDFKRRIIKPAIDELNGTGMFEIEIKENRVGKAVESIDFIVSDLDKRKYFEKELAPVPNEEGSSEGDDEEVPSEEAPTEDDNEEAIQDESEEEVAEDIEESKEEVKKVDKPVKVGETVIPEETCLVKHLHRLVKITFKGIDFTEGEYYMAFVESEVATQLQDGVEEISLKEWGYFKATLQNKISEIQAQEEKVDRAKTLEEKLLGW